MGGELALLVALATAVTAAPSWAAAAVPTASTAVGVAVLVALAGGASDDELVAGVAALVAAVAVGSAGRLARERRVVLAERAQEREADRVRAEARRTEQALAAERARIARELHDVVAHEVTVMVSLADGAQVALDRAPERAREVMAQVSATGREALRELRGLLGVLAPADGPDAGSAPQPGLDQLGELVQRVRESGLAASLSVEGAARSLDPIAQLTLYRVAQEALTNVLRHARSATRADVRLRTADDGVELVVVDDGAGAVAAGAGRGLLGMRQRAALHDAQLTAGPAAQGGWQVALRLPLPAPTPASPAAGEVHR
nr:histidine kinase [Modestobacter versicolor]